MGFFSKIMDKIFGHAKAETPAGTTESGTAQQSAPAGQQPTATATAAPAKLSDVDVDAVLTKLAASKGGGGNWRTSIVDLLKLLDLDSSLAARKELATDLNVRAGADGSAEQNIALSKAVWKALAENGGKVPANLRD